jgi:hypothetical protein
MVKLVASHTILYDDIKDQIGVSIPVVQSRYLSLSQREAFQVLLIGSGRDRITR